MFIRWIFEDVHKKDDDDDDDDDEVRRYFGSRPKPSGLLRPSRHAELSFGAWACGPAPHEAHT
eukprot:570426-Karenia_brevis.AAC.1